MILSCLFPVDDSSYTLAKSVISCRSPPVTSVQVTSGSGRPEAAHTRVTSELITTFRGLGGTPFHAGGTTGYKKSRYDRVRYDFQFICCSR